MSDTKKAVLDLLSELKGPRLSSAQKALINNVRAAFTPKDIIIPDTRTDKIKVCMIIDVLLKKIPQLDNPINEKPFERFLERIGFLEQVNAERLSPLSKYKPKK